MIRECFLCISYQERGCEKKNSILPICPVDIVHVSLSSVSIIFLLHIYLYSIFIFHSLNCTLYSK